MSLLESARTRYTTKAYDTAHRLTDDQVNDLLELLRLTPSSVNIQPWHFFVAGTEDAKALIRPSVQGTYAANEPKVMQASHVIVLCTKTQIDEAHFEALRAQESQDGRYASAEVEAAGQKGRRFYVGQHTQDMAMWLEKQTYIALGALLLGAADAGIDATPIEGFDRDTLNRALNLSAKGLTSSVVVALGHRSAADPNAALPKSRLSRKAVTTVL